MSNADVMDLVRYNPSTAPLAGDSQPLQNNILVFGYSGSGVSSLVNTVATALSKPPTVVKTLAKTAASTDPNPTRTTTALLKYPLSNVQPGLKANLWESWGIDSEDNAHEPAKQNQATNNYESIELDLLLRGLLPERFSMPRNERELTQVIGQAKKAATPLNMIHAAVFVVPRAMVDNASRTQVTRVQAILQQLQDRGRDPLVVVTKLDEALMDREGDGVPLDKLAVAGTLRRQAASLFNLPLANVFCTSNYSAKRYQAAGKRVEVLDQQAIRILAAALQKCQEFLESEMVAATTRSSVKVAAPSSPVARKSSLAVAAPSSNKLNGSVADTSGEDKVPNVAETVKKLELSPAPQSAPKRASNGLALNDLLAQFRPPNADDQEQRPTQVKLVVDVVHEKKSSLSGPSREEQAASVPPGDPRDVGEKNTTAEPAPIVEPTSKEMQEDVIRAKKEVPMLTISTTATTSNPSTLSSPSKSSPQHSRAPSSPRRYVPPSKAGKAAATSSPITPDSAFDEGDIAPVEQVRNYRETPVALKKYHSKVDQKLYAHKTAVNDKKQKQPVSAEIIAAVQPPVPEVPKKMDEKDERTNVAMPSEAMPDPETPVPIASETIPSESQSATRDGGESSMDGNVRALEMERVQEEPNVQVTVKESLPEVATQSTRQLHVPAETGREPSTDHPVSTPETSVDKDVPQKEASAVLPEEPQPMEKVSEMPTEPMPQPHTSSSTTTPAAPTNAGNISGARRKSSTPKRYIPPSKRDKPHGQPTVVNMEDALFDEGDIVVVDPGVRDYAPTKVVTKKYVPVSPSRKTSMQEETIAVDASKVDTGDEGIRDELKQVSEETEVVEVEVSATSTTSVDPGTEEDVAKGEPMEDKSMEPVPTETAHLPLTVEPVQETSMPQEEPIPEAGEVLFQPDVQQVAELPRLNQEETPVTNQPTNDHIIVGSNEQEHTPSIVQEQAQEGTLNIPLAFTDKETLTTQMEHFEMGTSVQSFLAQPVPPTPLETNHVSTSMQSLVQQCVPVTADISTSMQSLLDMQKPPPRPETMDQGMETSLPSLHEIVLSVQSLFKAPEPPETMDQAVGTTAITLRHQSTSVPSLHTPTANITTSTSSLPLEVTLSATDQATLAHLFQHTSTLAREALGSKSKHHETFARMGVLEKRYGEMAVTIKGLQEVRDARKLVLVGMEEMQQGLEKAKVEHGELRKSHEKLVQELSVMKMELPGKQEAMLANLHQTIQTETKEALEKQRKESDQFFIVQIESALADVIQRADLKLQQVQQEWEQKVQQLGTATDAKLHALEATMTERTHKLQQQADDQKTEFQTATQQSTATQRKETEDLLRANMQLQLELERVRLQMASAQQSAEQASQQVRQAQERTAHLEQEQQRQQQVVQLQKQLLEEKERNAKAKAGCCILL